MSSGATWATTVERGSVGALRAMAWLYRRFGRSVSVMVLTPIAAYFMLRDGTARRASRQYLRRLHAWPEGRPAFEREPGLVETFRHLREFAISIFDRLCVWTGEMDRVEIRDEGSEHLFRLARERRGAILLGAHIGSFDMLRVLSERQKLKVNALMFARHVAQLTSTVVKPLTEGEVVPRAEREKRARELLEAYARSLEEACCRAPGQWFNFYDFWDAHPLAEEPGRRGARRAGHS